MRRANVCCEVSCRAPPLQAAGTLSPPFFSIEGEGMSAAGGFYPLIYLTHTACLISWRRMTSRITTKKWSQSRKSTCRAPLNRNLRTSSSPPKSQRSQLRRITCSRSRTPSRSRSQIAALPPCRARQKQAGNSAANSLNWRPPSKRRPPSRARTRRGQSMTRAGL